MTVQASWPPSALLLNAALEEHFGVGVAVKEVAPLVEEGDKGFSLSDVCRILLRTPEGEEFQLLLRRGRTGGQGQEFDADVWREVLWKYHTCSELPGHSKPTCLLIGTQHGLMVSGAIGDIYLIEEFIEGIQYYECLEALIHGDESIHLAEVRVDALVQYLLQLHKARLERPEFYLRRIRDLIGAGDGFFGVLDSYLSYRHELNEPILRLLTKVEEDLPQWRILLRAKTHRLCRIHGDFHPWNVFFTDDQSFRVIDCSRGTWGDSADDLAAMTVNYVLFGLRQHLEGFRTWSRLFLRFWSGYLEGSGDSELLNLIPPFFAHRLCVLASPQWYPKVDLVTRAAMLNLATDLLSTQIFEPESLFDQVAAYFDQR